MDDEEELGDIPEIVGLSKKQFFLFFIGSTLIGAGMFGIGYISALNKNFSYINATNSTNAHEENLNIGKSQIGINKKAIATAAQENYSSLQYVDFKENEEPIAKNPHEKFFIIFGRFINQNDAVFLQKKLETTGKQIFIKTSENAFIVFAGPFDSYDLARNELENIQIKTSLSGSLVNVI